MSEQTWNWLWLCDISPVENNKIYVLCTFENVKFCEQISESFEVEKSHWFLLTITDCKLVLFFDQTDQQN